MASGDADVMATAERKFQADNEKRTEELKKIDTLDADFTTLSENAVDFNINEADVKEQAQARADPDYMLFLKAEQYLKEEGMKNLKTAQKKRMPMAIAPFLKDTGIGDRENNKVYHIVVHKPQVDDVIKACRKGGFVARDFVYNRTQWEEEKKELTELTDRSENKRKHLNQLSTDIF